MVSLFLVAPAWAQQGSSDGITADRVDAAVADGLAYLYARQTENGSWDVAPQHRGLAEAMVALAALEVGETLESPQLKAAVTHLTRLDPRTVQIRSARARVYARLPKTEYGDKLQADVAWLLKQQQKSGGWGYGPDSQPRADWTDATNTSAAVLALHEAAGAGATVPVAVWRNALKWWMSLQNRDGGWGFHPTLRPDSYGTPTASAMVSLHLLHLRMAGESAAMPRPPRKPNPLAASDRQILVRGWEWLDSRYSITKIPKYPAALDEDYVGQYQLAMQQAARLAGVNELAGRSIQRELVASLLEQRTGGPWTDTGQKAERAGQPGVSILPTALAVQILARARQSEVVGWLAVGAEFDPFAVENVCRALAGPLKATVSWRKVLPRDLAQNGPPVVLMTWDGVTPFDGELIGGLRRYVAAGGFVLVQPLGGDKQLAGQARDLLTSLSLGLAPVAMGADHPLLSLGAMPSSYKPALSGLADFTGLRAAVLEEDLTGLWHIGRRMDSAVLLANVVRYVTDAGPLPSPLASSVVAPPAGPSAGEIVVARVKLGDAWAGFSNAAPRVGEALMNAMSLTVRQAEAVDLTRDVPGEIDLLWLPAAGKFSLSDAQRQTLTTYLQAGGTLFLDAATGEADTASAVLELAQTLCGKENVRELPAGHALFTGQLAGGSGADVTSPAWTTVVQNGRRKPDRVPLHGGTIDGRLCVIASPLAVTGPAAGPTLYGCRGLSTPDARRLLCNVLLFAAEE